MFTILLGAQYIQHFVMGDNYFLRYLPLLIHFCVAAAIAIGMVGLSQLVGKHKYSKAKMSPYECGMTPVGDARQRFP